MSDARARVLSALQRDLESIYRVEAPLPVEDVVIDRPHWERLSASGAGEELVVVEHPDGLEVGLFVDEEVVRTLDGTDGAWTQRRLAAHCQAVEGVSHFLYLSHRAGIERPVSQLELELQAEIDKFATVLLSLWDAGRRADAPRLRERLFERVTYRENLTPGERERYEKANVLARAYCRFLETKYVMRNSIEGFLADLRRIYRLGAGDKLSYAAQGAAL